MRELWRARVHGGGGRFERATLLVDVTGRFVLQTSSRDDGSADSAVLEHDDVVRLAEVLEDELHRRSGS